MTTQPEALRLAKLIEGNWSRDLGHEAAAELRRLYEIEMSINSIVDNAAVLFKENNELHEANQELLEALHSISLASQDSGSTREGMGLYARTAIAKATGGQHD